MAVIGCVAVCVYVRCLSFGCWFVVVVVAMGCRVCLMLLLVIVGVDVFVVVCLSVGCWCLIFGMSVVCGWCLVVGCWELVRVAFGALVMCAGLLCFVFGIVCLVLAVWFCGVGMCWLQSFLF